MLNEWIVSKIITFISSAFYYLPLKLLQRKNNALLKRKKDLITKSYSEDYPRVKFVGGGGEGYQMLVHKWLTKPLSQAQWYGELTKNVSPESGQ